MVTDTTMSLSTTLTSLSSTLTTSFPSTTLGIPIATVCPLDADSNIAQAFLPISLPTISSGILTTSIIPASAKLPDGSMTTFSSLTSGEVDAPDPSEVTTTILPDGISAIQLDSDGLAKILVGSDGCQTLYKPSVTAICSTVVTPIGLPAVTVTDCDQYITFSSETLFTCAPTPTVVPRPAASGSSSSSAGGAVLTRTLPADSLAGPLLSSSPAVTQDLAADAVTTTATEGNLNSVPPLSVSRPVSTSMIASPSTTSAILALSPTTRISISTPPANANINVKTTKFPLSPNNGKPVAHSRRALSSLTYTTPLANDVPMSVPRHLLPQNQPAYRQVMINKGRPISTDLVTVTPDAAVQMEMETMTVSAEVSVSTMADEPRGRSPMEVVKAILLRRQVDGDGNDADVDAAVAATNATLFNTTIVDTDVDATKGIDTNIGIKQADELNLTESLSVSTPSVSIPLLPLTMSIPTDDFSLDDISSITSSAVSLSSLTLPTETDMPISTTVADADVDTMATTSNSMDPVPASTTNIPSDITPASSDLSMPDTNIPTLTDTPTNSSTNIPADVLTDIPTPKNDLALLSGPQPTKYYAAPWYQFLPNSAPAIPTNIKGIICRGGLEPIGSCSTPDTDGDTESCECEVHDEIWSVTNLTLTRVGTTRVVFSGSVSVEGSTTVVSVDQVLTTTATGVVGRVVRSTVTTAVTMSGMDGEAEGEGTVYATLTSYPSVTMTLVPNASGNISANGNMGSSSTVDAAMNINAAMPQGAPSLIAAPTGTGSDTLISMLTSTPMGQSVSYPTSIAVLSISTPTADVTGNAGMFIPPQNMAGSTVTDKLTLGLNTIIEGTVMITSIIATETVTVPPGDQSGFGPMPTELVSSEQNQGAGTIDVEGSETIDASQTVPMMVRRRRMVW